MNKLMTLFYKERSAIKSQQDKKDGENETILNRGVKVHLINKVTLGKELKKVRETSTYTSESRIFYAKKKLAPKP